ncbi:MAG: 2-hydroxyacyl-CoA dehydratase [Chloroflexi bacterium]|nr:2-hydroxyacyl-CoA dehydratase [Chloroflexota bacterium]
MVPVAALTGLQKVKYIYNNRLDRVKELKSEGKRIIGYLCSMAPLEILEAAGLVPFRIMGSPQKGTASADVHIETNMCPYVRNCFARGLEGEFGFLDGLLLSHTCDSVLRLYGLWKYHLDAPFTHCVNVPHTISEPTIRFFREEIELFKEKVEQYAGQEISGPALRASIELYNANKALVKELYGLRKEDPPLISGTEMMETLVAGLSIPAREFNQLLREVKDEVITRPPKLTKKPRLLLHGCIMDKTGFVSLIEKCGAKVVMDDTCIGTRTFWNEVATDGDLLDGLIDSYFKKFQCPRTYRGRSLHRFDYLRQYATDYNAQGMISYIMRFCDCHSLDAPDMRDYLRELRLPVLIVEDDYTEGAVQSLRVRIQAFIESVTEISV